MATPDAPDGVRTTGKETGEAKSAVEEHSTAAETSREPSQPNDDAVTLTSAPPASPAPAACAHESAGSSASGSAAPSKRTWSTR